MKKSIIVAMSEDRVIASTQYGNRFGLIWDLPEDRKLFRKMTLHKPVVMGRKTFESIGCVPLPKRDNIILSTNKSFDPKGVKVASCIDSALSLCKDADEVMICGGAKIYEATLPLVDRLYISEVKGSWEGDVFFPAIDWSLWDLRSQENKEGFVFKIWDKKV